MRRRRHPVNAALVDRASFGQRTADAAANAMVSQLSLFGSPVDVVVRCETCGGTLSGTRSHARFCSRRCKAKAAELRRAPRDNQVRYQREREHRMAYARERSRMHPEESKVRRMARRARKYDNPGYVPVTAWERARILYRARGLCGYCGEKSPDLHLDHVIPLKRGGRHAPGNLVAVCPACNYAKHASLLAEWRCRDRRKNVDRASAG